MVSLAAGAALLATGCVFPPPPPPPPGPVDGCAASSAASSADDPGSPPLAPAVAASTAAAAFAAAPVRNPDGSVPLVVVTADESGAPRPVTVDVGSATDAAAIGAWSAAVADVVGVGAAQRVRVAEANDPYRDDQWALDRVAFEGVWPATSGAGVRVAVVDTGVRASHPDLSGQVLAGWQFLGDDPVGVPSDGSDPQGHGTHVAGTIAAVANNHVGTAGAAPGVDILPVRVLDSSGTGWDADIGRGITWAVDHGADVVNLSLGSNSPSVPIGLAVSYALAHDVVVVAASGNDGNNGSPPSWPAAYDETIAVAAVDSNLVRASFSTMGSYVDVAAPGVAVVAPYKAGYAFLSGTSMAAPHVSALAALVRAEHPGDDVAQVRAAIEGTADDLGPPGFDAEYGFGIIDPVAAVGCS